MVEFDGHLEIDGNVGARTRNGENTVCEIVSRGELIEPTNYVNLTIQFRDAAGNPKNTDVFPNVSIVSPTGLVVAGPTSSGVGQIGIGQYNYLFQAPIAGPFGVWNDVWVGYINGYRVSSTFSFVVSHTDLPSINTDGKMHLGDDVGFQYDQASIYNINKLLKMVKARLNSSGKAKSTDPYGNVIFVDCDIYSIDMLVSFLAMSLNKFNTTPYFTNFVWQDATFFAQFGEVIAEGAVVFALASQALIERGREFQLNDNGISFTPPTVSELLNTQFSTEIAHMWEQVKMIKASMRPNPMGLGVFSMTNGVNPAVRRLRFLRERQII
jgi:hypothetical protein